MLAQINDIIIGRKEGEDKKPREAPDAPVEFGAKVEVSLVKGYARIEKLS